MANTVGTMVGYNVGVDLKEKFLKCQELGINSCQVNIWNTSIFTSDEHAEIVKNAIAETGTTVSSLWAGWSGPCEWNFTAGPDTIGLVPAAYRHIRLDTMTETETLRQLRPRLRFSGRMADALLQEGIHCLQEAKALHDKLEAIYHPHVDFSRVDAVAETLLSKLEIS